MRKREEGGEREEARMGGGGGGEGGGQRHVDKHKYTADRQASMQTDRKASTLVFSPSQPVRLYQADWRDETMKPVKCNV